MIKFYTEKSAMFDLKYCIDCAMRYKILNQSFVIYSVIDCGGNVKKKRTFCDFLKKSTLAVQDFLSSEFEHQSYSTYLLTQMAFFQYRFDL